MVLYLSYSICVTQYQFGGLIFGQQTLIFALFGDQEIGLWEVMTILGGNFTADMLKIFGCRLAIIPRI